MEEMPSKYYNPLSWLSCLWKENTCWLLKPGPLLFSHGVAKGRQRVHCPRYHVLKRHFWGLQKALLVFASKRHFCLLLEASKVLYGGVKNFRGCYGALGYGGVKKLLCPQVTDALAMPLFPSQPSINISRSSSLAVVGFVGGSLDAAWPVAMDHSQELWEGAGLCDQGILPQWCL